MGEPIVIWGAGAIGGTLGAFWARAGIDVLFVDSVAEHVEACRTEGLSIEGPVAAFRQCVAAVTPEELTGTFSRIVLAVKAHHTEEAVVALAPHLAADGFVLSAQNGLNELVIARHVGDERTMGAFVNFGADWLGPGRILFGNRAAVVVGEIDGATRDRTREMHRLLSIFEPDAVLTDNIWGYLWGKLGYGAMLFATALTDDSMADNFADPDRLPIWEAIGREVVAVALARGVRPLGFDGYDPLDFAPHADTAKVSDSIAALVDLNRHGAKTHSGIWRDLAVRKRRTEVDAQIAVIDTLGREVGVDTPTIRKLVALIHDVEEGRRPRSSATLRNLL
ncbi:MAG: ketopantoate reductase family protein [Alphaproteobacteria bacterium]|nr:ketopantoate reductase family protein [Alphaproteobacteria bacterium]